MKFTEIKELLDKGFTPDQIMTLANEPETATTPEPAAEAALEPKPEPAKSETFTDERLNALEKSINELTKTIQANAILNDMQPGQSVKTDMEILASVINPGSK